MSTREIIAKGGTEGKYISPWYRPTYCLPVNTFWRPEAVCTTGDRKGSSVSYSACDSIEEAKELLELYMNDKVESKMYDDWYIVRYQPLIEISIEV